MAKAIVLDRVAVITEMARQELSTLDLAQRAHVGLSAVSKARNGQPLWRNTAQHLADGLGVPLEALRREGTHEQQPQ